MTSENPSSENNAKNHTDGTTDKESHTAPDLIPPAGISKSDTPPTAHSYQITCKTEKDWRDKVKFWVEVVGLAFLIVYTIFTALMYCANKKAADAATKSANTAEQTMRLDERAWVAIPSVSGTWPQADKKQLKFVVLLKNTGRSPALNVIIYPGEEVIGRNIAPTFTKAIGSVRLGILSPESERTYENLVSIASIDVFKTQTLSVHGRVTYDDIFGCHHWVTYAAHLKDDWSGFSFYPENNDTDNDYQPCKT